MKAPDLNDLNRLSMLELFRVEIESQSGILTAGLLDLERNPGETGRIEVLMRAAHSIKGAARIVNLDAGVRIAHALEDCLVAAQGSLLHLDKPDIDLMLRGVDLLNNLAQQSETALPDWELQNDAAMGDFLNGVLLIINSGKGTQPAALSPAQTRASGLGSAGVIPNPQSTTSQEAALPHAPVQTNGNEDNPNRLDNPEAPDRILRLGAENLNRLLGLAGEELVESRWLRPFNDSMIRLKRMQWELIRNLSHLQATLEQHGYTDSAAERLSEVSIQLKDCQQTLANRLADLDLYDRRSANLSHRLYREVIQCRMRPFLDGASRFPRMVRDLARSLNKEVRLEILGENTQVDRDILEKLETPLAHLLRNAVDHGCETPSQRRQRGKPEECTIRLEARHHAGMLQITVSDDGAGIDLEHLRRSVVTRQLAAPEMAANFKETELLQFLFLPGFTLKDTVTEISGRGVGLDVVQNLVKSLRGSIRVATTRGLGVRFQLKLPLTLSVVRTLLVEVAGEPYALPLSRIKHTIRLPKDQIETLGGRPYATSSGQQIGLISARLVLGYDAPGVTPDPMSVIVLGDRTETHGLVVDRFLTERELVIHPLDPRLGKIKDISAAALMENGAPVLLLDVEDLLQSMDKHMATGVPNPWREEAQPQPLSKRKRILTVDDSLTVRELERKLLSGHGYDTDVAVDGMDGWNAIRAGDYDLVITDVDMPRMDGIELTALIRQDARFKSLPVMIVSYKDREEDRLRGLQAGADYYLAKGSFHDSTLIQAVIDLIGEADL